ncbi:MAG: hypothetical protein SGJ18_02525 [Pseudomonadota bacterium]|nr:hypothetical protein [Pseudomonadota bacterium]
MQSKEIKILALAQNIEDIERALEFCRNKGWHATCVHDLEEGMKLIAQENPDFVLVSYDHKNEKIREFAPIIARSFGVQVIALCERKTKISSRVLAQSGFRYLLFPPISGEGIYDKILKIITSTQKSKLKEPLPEKKETRKHQALFDVEPEALEDAGVIVIAGEAKKTKMKIIPGDKRTERKASKPKDKQDFFSQIVGPAFRKVFGREGMIALKMNPDITMTEVISVRTEGFSGFLVFDLQVAEFLRTKLVNSFIKEVKLTCTNLGRTLSFSEVVAVEFSQVSRQTFLAAAQKFFMGEDTTRLTMLFAFNDSKNTPKLTQDQNGKTCIVSHEDIASDIPLDFSVYIHLPKNKKYYLFVRKGRKFTAKRVQRLKDMEHELFIYKNEETDFYRYFFKSRFLGEILKPYLERKALVKTG